MKKIVLAPIKNEAWILRTFLSNLAWADHIILADQKSTDESRLIAAEFSNVIMIDNPFEGHTNKIRWTLLDEARKIQGEKIIFCLDADEIMTLDALNWTLEQVEVRKADTSTDAKKYLSFRYPWIQMYRDIHTYRIDGPWKENIKALAFLDNPYADYPRTEVINDHTNRIPDNSSLPDSADTSIELICPHPVLHLQYLPLERMYIKQAWYMCREFLTGKSAKVINLKYHPALVPVQTKHLRPVESNWMRDIKFNENLLQAKPDQDCLEYIKNNIDEKGVEAFEALDIWRSTILNNLFIKKTGRKPKADMLFVHFAPFTKIIPRRVKIMIQSFLNSSR